MKIFSVLFLLLLSNFSQAEVESADIEQDLTFKFEAPQEQTPRAPATVKQKKNEGTVEDTPSKIRDNIQPERDKIKFWKF